MSDDRKKKLEKNFFKIFFINSLLNLKMINAIISLFFVYRSLRVADIFYLGIIYSFTVIVSEVPSSYLADKFGRKRTVIMATCFALLHWAMYLIADSFALFAVGAVFFALAESFMSGTDEAFVFDTNKELGDHNQSFKKLAYYFSSERVFKIFSAFLGVIIAKDLASWQFSLIILADVVASIIAMLYAFTLVEPNHYMDVEQQEANLIKDAYRILAHDKNLLWATFNKMMIVVTTAACWRYAAVLFVDSLRIPVIIFGFVWSVHHLVIFAGNRLSDKIWLKNTIGSKINILNSITCGSVALFLIAWFFYLNKYIIFAGYILMMASSALRDPFFSHLFNQQFRSYNRATTLSLVNFVRHIMEIPFLPVIAWMVSKSMVLPYVMVLLSAVLALTVFRMKKVSFNNQLYATTAV